MSTKELEKTDEIKNNAEGICESNVKLRRELGLFSAVNLILGVMIGSGIFVSPASALEHSGSVALCLIIWTVSGIISLLGALSFAELGTVLGKSGAEYSYFQAAFGKMHRYWGPLPSFICAWIYVVILRPAEVAIIVMTFAEYAIQPFTADLQEDYKSTAIKLGSLSALSSKMSNENTKENLSRDIKQLREQCVSSIANSASFNIPHLNMSPEKASVQMTQSYIQGLQAQIQNSETVVPTDENLIINQFIAEMKLKNEDVEKLIAFTQGVIFDTNNEIERLSDHSKQVVEALNKPLIDTHSVSIERIERAKDNFRDIKKELHKIIKSIFKNDSNLVFEFIGELMQEKLNPETNGYVQVTDHMFPIAELLHDMKIISKNPYAENEVKLAY